MEICLKWQVNQTLYNKLAKEPTTQYTIAICINQIYIRNFNMQKNLHKWEVKLIPKFGVVAKLYYKIKNFKKRGLEYREYPQKLKIPTILQK